MPIYEESYRSWHGQLDGKLWTWFVIAKTGIRLLWKRGMILLLLLSSIPFFVRAVQIYLMTRYGDQVNIGQVVDGFKINPGFFYSFLQGQTFLLLLVLIFSGASLIANDRKFKALPLYFSKPVGFGDYVLGKFLVVGFYGSLVTVVPGLILFLVRVALARDASFLKTFYWVPLSLLGYTAIALVVLGGLILALSSAARGTRSAAILFFAIIMFPDVFRQILSRIPEVSLFSLTADLRQVGAALFAQQAAFPVATVWSWVALVVAVAVTFGVLWLKVRPTEVVR